MGLRRFPGGLSPFAAVRGPLCFKACGPGIIGGLNPRERTAVPFASFFESCKNRFFLSPAGKIASWRPSIIYRHGWRWHWFRSFTSSLSPRATNVDGRRGDEVLLGVLVPSTRTCFRGGASPSSCFSDSSERHCAARFLRKQVVVSSFRVDPQIPWQKGLPPESQTACISPMPQVRSCHCGATCAIACQCSTDETLLSELVRRQGPFTKNRWNCLLSSARVPKTFLSP